MQLILVSCNFLITYQKKKIGIGGIVGAEIKTIFVHPDFQKSGVGKKVMLRIEEEAKSLGLKKVFLHAAIHAEKFYHKLGFKKKQVLEVKLDDFINRAVLMEKKL